MKRNILKSDSLFAFFSRKFPFYQQLDRMDCGPTTLRIITKYYGKDFDINTLRKLTDVQKKGVNLLSVSNAAELIGFNTFGAKLTLSELYESGLPLPCILHWKRNHFIVLYRIIKPGSLKAKFVIGDPAQTSILTIDKYTFLKCWIGEASEGIALFLTPSPSFHEYKDDYVDAEENPKASWSLLWQHLRLHRKYFLQIFLGLLAASLFQLMLPFLTQSIVDNGVNMQNISFVYMVLIAQLVLLAAKTIVEFSRQGLLLFISTHVNLSMLTDFWKKLMRLPLSYFDTKQTGDILQRIGDQSRLESFLTGNSINIAFSMLNLLLYSFIMLLYSVPVFFIFATGSALYLLWISFFLKQRRNLNYKQFALASRENSATMQLIYGMQEIKMHNAERHFRWSWERIQRSLFGIGFKNLSLNQMQEAGALVINEGKNLLVTGIVATAVIKGELTLGAMLAIEYILGALNSPINQFVFFIQDFQDAKISLERLNEIHQEKEELHADAAKGNAANYKTGGMKGISIQNLSFGYTQYEEDKVLHDITLQIPAGKVTAIVGMSGSGKTTLLKILQKFYDEKYKGNIKVGSTDENTGTELKYIIPEHWRNEIGCVMQDGFVFNASITENIAVGEETPDFEQLQYAARMANILSFIESLPLGFHTGIGAEGMGISMGQKQRLLIARAIYKNPQLLFFDEATNSLDANNEKVILENLQAFFQGRTVVVVAHRLSTVKNADKIVVLEKGAIAEEGTHTELTARKGKYYELVKNQLELGN